MNRLPQEVVTDQPGGEWLPVQRAEEQGWTMVNGDVTFEDGEATCVLPGRLLRHGRG